jgi:hypothetical protein
MEIEKLLDECKAKLGVESDYALAKALDIHTGLISDYRALKREPDEYACLKFAEVLELDAEMLIVHFAARKAKNPKVKEYLQKYYERLGGLAAGIFLAVSLIMTPTPSEAAPLLKSGASTMYIMLNARRVINRAKKAALLAVNQITRFCESILRVRQVTA